jgi:Methyltransferase domain
MYEGSLSERYVDSPVPPVFAPDEVPAPPQEQNKIHAREDPRLAKAGSFLDLLGDLERYPSTGDRSQAIARYQAWIGRNSAASPALYAAWFNLGVELAGAGDKAGAIDAYQTVLALKPSFYPAAINLGTLMESTGQPELALATWQQALQPDEARAALLEYRDRLDKAYRVALQSIPAVLHIGCGASAHAKLPPMFLGPDWREIRADTDPDVHPDFIAGLTDMHVISDGSVDAVYSSEAIENLYPHEVPLALREIHRVLKPTGFTLIRLPDLQEVARHVAEGKLEEPLYISPIGPITPLDILYGHRPSMASGNAFKPPRTGFTSTTLAAALINAGFGAAMVQRDPAAFRLTALAFRGLPDEVQMARARAQMLPAIDQPIVLYTPAG